MTSQGHPANKSGIKNKVYVGMSGGVDSSVSAALLKKDGYDVTGVFIKVWQPDWIECNWKQDRLDAMRVAAHLEIPFVTLDLEKEYKQGVIDYMISEYEAGRTPNPDVMCNREVKFGAFWQWAKNQGADYIATGHYAINVKYEIGNMKLMKGVDSNKDQTYFLWTLNQKDLEHVLFPVGHLPKPEVRELARKFKLPTAEKRDSQGLCFVGTIDIKEFLTHYVTSKEGNVLNTKGEVVGKHPGALFFTFGERHGFTITKKTPNDKPVFVVKKDIKNNTITVSDNKLAETSDSVELTRVNWTRAQPSIGQSLSVRTRYRQTLISASVQNVTTDSVTLKLDNPVDPVTPGQSLVMYDGEECVGGGII